MKLAVLLACGIFCAVPIRATSLTVGDLLATLRKEVNPQTAMEKMRRIHENDRWFTFPRFAKTAAYLERSMKDAGLEQVEIVRAPANGKDQFGYWTMPMAWDARGARLEIVSPPLPAEQRVLADYQQVPAALGMWSGGTPADGVLAEVVEWKPGIDAKGKLVLTSKNPAGLKWQLVKAGALGAINGFSENPELKDDRQWINAWGDKGWAFVQGDTPLLSFSVTPRQADHLRKLLAAGPVRVRANADTRYYEGEYPYVTGVIRGTESDQEVLTLGHTSEMGAHDNATGVAAMVESLATLNRLIETGVLARPRRTIRVLAMGELYASSHYIASNPERIRRTVAALCYDTPAGPYQLAGTEYTFYLNPHAGSSFVDAFTMRLAREYFGSVKRPVHEHPYITGTDNFLGEPMIGVPTAWPYSGTGVHSHHNSADTPDTVDARSIRDLTIYNAAFLYYLASAGQAEAEWLAEIAAARGYEQIVSAGNRAVEERNRGTAKPSATARIRYMADLQKQAVESIRSIARLDVSVHVKRLEQLANLQLERIKPLEDNVEEKSEFDADAAGIVVVRKRFGTIPLDELNEDQRMGFPSAAWALTPITALYWTDGKRSLAEVIRLTNLELGPTKFDFVGYFKFLKKHGYVEFR